MAQHAENSYYVPHGSRWPIVGSLGMITMLASAANWMNGSATAEWTFWLGMAIIIFMMFGWFGTVIRESESGMYNSQVDGSFRLGMTWFIFSEVMFFAVFFGTLFYVRNLAVPWLGGEGTGAATNEYLWQGYMPVWPTNGPGDIGGEFHTIPAFGVPFINTLILSDFRPDCDPGAPRTEKGTPQIPGFVAGSHGGTRFYIRRITGC